MNVSRDAHQLRRSAEIGRLLEAEKTAACDEVARCVRNPDCPRLVVVDGTLIAWIDVEVLLNDGYGDEPEWCSFVGFVHLTRAGRDLVRLPWSPHI
jgi:hypothetical protein